MNQNSQVVMIVGAAGGIGKNVATRMATEEYSLILADQNLAKLKDFKQKLDCEKVSLIEVDITNKKSIDNMIIDAIDRFGRIDLLINAAGVCDFIGFEEVTEEKWDHLLAVNLKGPFIICQSVAKIMMKQGSGNIINIASVAGENAGVFAGIHYSVSKSGLITMSKVLAKVLASFNIRVNVVSPGPVETEMISCWTAEMRNTFCSNIPLGRLAEPEDITGAIMFLASPESSYITGQVLGVNGGVLV